MAAQIQCAVCECLEASCKPCKAPEECSNCVACCCTVPHAEWRNQTIRQGLRLQYFSLGWMSLEVAAAVLAGLLASSFALLAFGGDSVVELISGWVVLRHLRLDSAGSTVQGKRTATFTSLLLISLVPVIGIGSTYSFFVLKVVPETSVLGLVISAGAVVIMPFLWRKKREIGVETGCLPLAIDAMESATCFLMALVLFGGLALESVFHVGWFDYLATLAILGFIAYEGRESFAEARKETASML